MCRVLSLLGVAFLLAGCSHYQYPRYAADLKNLPPMHEIRASEALTSIGPALYAMNPSGTKIRRGTTEVTGIIEIIDVAGPSNITIGTAYQPQGFDDHPIHLIMAIGQAYPTPRTGVDWLYTGSADALGLQSSGGLCTHTHVVYRIGPDRPWTSNLLVWAKVCDNSMVATVDQLLRNIQLTPAVLAVK